MCDRRPACIIIQQYRFGGGSVMAWGGISMEGCTDVYMLVNGPLTAIRYRDEILGPIVRPFAGAVGPGFPCPASCVQELSDALVQIREEIP